MEDKNMERSYILSSERSRKIASNMLQEEARELYELAESIPGKEWAEWYSAKRLSELRRKT